MQCQKPSKQTWNQKALVIRGIRVICLTKCYLKLALYKSPFKHCGRLSVWVVGRVLEEGGLENKVKKMKVLFYLVNVQEVAVQYRGGAWWGTRRAELAFKLEQWDGVTEVIISPISWPDVLSEKQLYYQPHLQAACFPAAQNTEGAKISLFSKQPSLPLLRVYAREEASLTGEAVREGVSISMILSSFMFHLEKEVLECQEPPGNTTVSVLDPYPPVQRGSQW